MTKKITKKIEKHNHWKELFDTEYLGAFNLAEGEEIIAKIEKITKENVVGSDGKTEELPVLHFHNGVPKMILNKTNAKLITTALGTAYFDKWVNRSIQIYATSVKAFGEKVDAIRIRDTAPKEEIDVSPTIAQLEKCKTYEELKSVFASLPVTIKGDSQVIAKKDELKLTLK